MPSRGRRLSAVLPPARKTNVGWRSTMWPRALPLTLRPSQQRRPTSHVLSQNSCRHLTEGRADATRHASEPSATLATVRKRTGHYSICGRSRKCSALARVPFSTRDGVGVCHFLSERRGKRGYPGCGCSNSNYAIIWNLNLNLRPVHGAVHLNGHSKMTSPKWPF